MELAKSAIEFLFFFEGKEACPQQGYEAEEKDPPLGRVTNTSMKSMTIIAAQRAALPDREKTKAGKRREVVARWLFSRTPPAHRRASRLRFAQTTADSRSF
jgi:hypothetical protein